MPAATEPHRKLAAILSADAVGYSRLMQGDERATLETLRTYRSAIQSLVEQHDGRVVNAPGDALLAEFPSAVEAVRCAVEIQQDLDARNDGLPLERRMHYRIGVNLGEVVEESDGTLYGDGVNIAARLEAMAEAAGVCISGKVFDEVKNKLELGFQFLGAQSVKHIADPVRVYRVALKGASTAAARAPKPWRRTAWGIVAGVLIALGLAVALIWQAARAPSDDPVLAMPDGPSIAVLPFVNLGGDPQDEYFADGITEEIITELARFRELFVLARNITFQYKGQSVDVKRLGRELGVRYVLEGSVRKATNRIRVTAQLIDTTSGAHLWADTYDRELTASNVLGLQDEITDDVAAKIAGVHGVISKTAFGDIQRKRPKHLTSYDCVLRAYAYYRLLTREAHLATRDCLEQAVKDDPNYAELWAHLAQMYGEEVFSGYNPQPDSLSRALDAALRAVKLDPGSQMGYYNLAYVRFLLGQRDEFLHAAERAVAINPNNAEVLAMMGTWVHATGEYQRGLALVRKAVALDPNPPGWHYFAFFWEHYRKGEYEEALVWAKKINMPEYYWMHIALAATYAQLGRQQEARTATERIYVLLPDFNPRKHVRMGLGGGELFEKALDGLRKAGVDIPPE